MRALVATGTPAAPLELRVVRLEGSWRRPLAALEAVRQRSLEGKAVLRVD
jgi:hypothetical protein